MTFFFIFIFLVYLGWRFLPRILVWLLQRNIEKRTRQFYDQARRQQSYGGQTQNSRPSQSRTHKKIDPDVGEYVDFEEVSTYTSATETSAEGQTVKKYESEEQVVDVEWEDV